MRPLLILIAFCSLWAFSLGVRADLYTEVNALVQSSQWQKAQALADERLKTVPTDPQMRLLLSRIQTGLGQTQAAIDTLQSLTQSFPELPEPHNNLAALLARENRLAEAQLSLEAAIKAKPDYALALENLGDIHAALAVDAYGKALKITPNVTRIQNKKLATEQLLKTP